ncbi:MAG TPA: DUF1707 and DUF4870 domain-containing protein [Actinopolymorphaceae bacterium]|nr:DUF1707 and DUF4870 domain-containing protein [Actinopolymorphaceae bacterium]
MTGGPGIHTSSSSSPSGALRISDAEREQAVEMLQSAYAEGRIDNGELDTRMGRVLRALDRADLSTALRGLPLPPSIAAPAGARVARAPATAPAADERTWAMLAHWSGIVTLFVGPALIALTKGRSSRYVRTQAWEAANFNVAFLGALLVVGIATGITFGIASVLFPVLTLAWLLLAGVGGLSAAAGNQWRYPWNLRLLG